MSLISLAKLLVRFLLDPLGGGGISWLAPIKISLFGREESLMFTCGWDRGCGLRRRGGREGGREGGSEEGGQYLIIGTISSGS